MNAASRASSHSKNEDEGKLVLNELCLQNTLALQERLYARSTWQSLLAFAVDWLVIVVAVGLVVHGSALLIPLSLFLIGSRQRALSNLVHDASHGNLIQHRGLNDSVTNWLAAYPLFDTVRLYRAAHMAHHRFLGSHERDPDSKSHLEYGYDDHQPFRGSALRLYASLISNPKALWDSFFGNLFKLPSNEKLKVTLWWSVVLSATSLLLTTKVTFAFIGLWMLARVTGYHAIRMFAEFMDHSGLKVGSVLGFTRNLPHWGLAASFLHPHQDTFHLIHHLLPRVPHYRLATAHKALRASPYYATAEHCESYFLGSKSAIKSWTGANRT